MRKVLLIDSSVVLRALVDESLSVRQWWVNQLAARAIFVGSKMLEVEVRRTVHNVRKHGGSPISAESVNYYLDNVIFIEITPNIIDTAISIEPPLSGADSIHIGTALSIGKGRVTIVTHDSQMARAAKFLGFQVIDPVTDDPKRPPVATNTIATS